MMAIHESGHVFTLWATGGRVAKVVLHPLTISRTDPATNPRPLPVVWGGPLFGILTPLAAFGISAIARVPWTYLLRFFAGFCLIANGCYLGAGLFDAVGDARELLKLGTPAWQLAVFGAITVPIGLYLWHGQGKHFQAECARPGIALTVLVIFIGTVTVEMLLSER
jgi:hypothetical protein